MKLNDYDEYITTEKIKIFVNTKEIIDKKINELINEQTINLNKIRQEHKIKLLEFNSTQVMHKNKFKQLQLDEQTKILNIIHQEPIFKLEEFISIQFIHKNKFEQLQLDELNEFILIQKTKITSIIKENKKKIVEYNNYLLKNNSKLLENENNINHKKFIVKTVTIDSSKNIYYSNKYYDFKNIIKKYYKNFKKIFCKQNKIYISN